MTHKAEIASDITLLITMAIAGPMFGWFFCKGWKSGLVETRFGNFAKSERPNAFGFFMMVYGFGLVIVTTTFAIICADIF